MNPEWIKRFLVTAGEVSYLEQASQTNKLIVAFTELYRHLEGEPGPVPLQRELRVMAGFFDVLGYCIGSTLKVSIPEHCEYQQVERGSAAAFLQAEKQTLPLTGTLGYCLATELYWYTETPMEETDGNTADC